MKAQVLPRITLALAALFIAPQSPAGAGAQAGDGGAWASARSEHFLVLGDAGAAEVRRVALRLERYRAFFRQLLPEDRPDSTPVTVVVFRDEQAYAPFKPLYQGRPDTSVAGYFQPGGEIDYITFSLEQERSRDSSSTLLHEYVHLLVKDSFRGAPAWLKEGLSEYYSTARFSDDGRRVTLGRPATARLRRLRAGGPHIPLRALLEADQASPYYNEPGLRDVFYAQSWALVHYLLGDGTAARRARISTFLGLAAAGKTAEESFRAAFGGELSEAEAALARYVRAGRLPERTEKFEAGAGRGDASVMGATLTEAEALAHLGDLLLRTDRPEEAEEYLRRAVALDESLSAAQTSLGALCLRQNRLAEAKGHLRRAVAADGQNHLAHYYYADALSREGFSAEISVRDFEETTGAIRAALLRSIGLAPDFLEARKLLALVELERGGRLDEAAAVLSEGLARAPERRDLQLLLAQVHLHKEEFGAARRIAAEVAAGSTDAHLRGRAQRVLEKIAASEERAARTRERNERPHPDDVPLATLPCDMPAPGPQYKRLRFSGEQVCGQLVQIDCEEARVLLLVEADGRTLRLRGAALNRIRFVSYTPDVRGSVTCGPQRAPASRVLVTYRAGRGDASKADGEVIAVEFVPPDWDRLTGP